MTNDRFVEYYSEESEKLSTIERFAATKAAVERVARDLRLSAGPWKVADIGCGAGTQSAMWARDGHQVFGLDINSELVALGRERARLQGLSIDFAVGSATSLPWPDASMDVCLSPELLEHVQDWQTCVTEAARVLRPGGVLYLSTTNWLCPVQHEFDLPGYSWYPPPLKRHYERLSVTSRPELVSHAQYPAVHWFSYFQLRRHLRRMGFECRDRFDVAALGAHGPLARTILAISRASPLTRLLAHAMTSYTVVFASKR